MEITELWAYQPSLVDCYLLLRIGGVDFEAKVDGSGEDCTYAATISQNYFRDGVIRSVAGHIALPGSLDVINTNAVFDAARRLSQVVRIMPRANFHAIARQGGKIILWFSRWARGASHDIPIDLFGGIAPAPNPILSGELVWGRRYRVSKGTVTYQKRGYTLGQIFTAAQDEPKFTGTGELMEADGVHDAPSSGWSNRWLLGLRLCQYNPNSASSWKPEVFADYFPLLNRCLVGDPAAADDPNVLYHLAYGNRLETPEGVISPQAPDSFNYVPTPASEAHLLGANLRACDDADTDCQTRRRNFYNSCRMFEPWPEAESVELDGDEIKVTLPFFHHDPTNDTADFSRDHATWDVTALRAEPFRTWVNGLREYQLWSNSGLNASFKVGDQALNSTFVGPDGLVDGFYGAILPSFHWVKLVPEPYEDGNDDQNDADTPLVHDPYPHLDLVIRAACEGFIDPTTTVGFNCASGDDYAPGVASFTWENLNFAADAGRGIPVLPTKATELIDAADTRPDQPEFFGPMPNVVVSAETAAAVARRLNLLTEFRVLLPMTLQYRTRTDEGSTDVTGQVRNSRGESAAATSAWSFGSSQYAVYYEGGSGGGGSTTYTDWADYGSPFGTSNSRSLSVDRTASPLTAALDTDYNTFEFRWNGTADLLDTLPAPIRDQLSLTPYFVAMISDRYDSFDRRTYVASLTGGSQCNSSGGPDTVWEDGLSGATLFTPGTRDYPDQCQAIRNGSISPGPIPNFPVYVSRVSGNGVAPDCVGSCFSNIQVTIYTPSSPAVHVPLADLAD